MNESLLNMIRQKKVSLYQIAKELDIPYTTLSNLHTGKLSINKCAAETVYKLSVYLGCSVPELLNDVIYCKTKECVGGDITLRADNFYLKYKENEHFICKNNELNRRYVDFMASAKIEGIKRDEFVDSFAGIAR